jgi:hypothetical protein
MEAGYRCVSPSRAVAGGWGRHGSRPGGGHGLPWSQPRMVPVMRRMIAMMAVLGGLTAGLGCQHIGGKSDCGYHPSDYPIAAPTPPYPAIPAPAVVVPKVKVGGSDRVPEVLAPRGTESGY